MTFSSQTIMLDPYTIQVNRETRQRRNLDVSDLLDSIRNFGVMNPIIIRREELKNSLTEGITYYVDELIAGERRLEACKQLNIKVPCRFISDLSPLELSVLEFEENHKRKSLPWREEVSAIGQIHASYLKENESHTQSQTAITLSIPEPKLSQILNVYDNLSLPILSHADNLSQAISLLARFQKTKETVISSEIKSLISTSKLFSLPTSVPIPKLAETDFNTIETPAPTILNQDFKLWIQTYSGPKFNLLHCDFSQNENEFWKLTNCLFGTLDKLLDEKAHIIFWLNLDFLYEMLDLYLINHKGLSYLTDPLIWYKSDTKPNQIFGDPPKHTYEAALVITYNQKSFLKPIQNLYSTPRASSPICPNQKSQPMLKYFFQNFVDENTNLLDPTCGSASALLAAEELDAKSTLGLEIDKERFEKAQAKIFRQREIQKLTKR